MRLIPKYKGGNQVKFKYRLGYDPELNIIRTAFVDIPEVVATPDADDYRRLALNRSRRATSPTVSFDNAIDLNWWQKLKENWVGHNCLNTVTSFYNPKSTGSINREFVANPKRYGFKEISQKEVLPGDIIMLSDKNHHPNHAVIFDSVFNGDTLVNYSNGTQNLETGYKKQRPLSIFLEPNAGGDFTGIHRYFRFTGK